jgi:hypothetical protein
MLFTSPAIRTAREFAENCHSVSLRVSASRTMSVFVLRGGQKRSRLVASIACQEPRTRSHRSIFAIASGGEPEPNSARETEASAFPQWCDQIPTPAENLLQPCSGHSCAHRHSHGSGKLFDD